MTRWERRSMSDTTTDTDDLDALRENLSGVIEKADQAGVLSILDQIETEDLARLVDRLSAAERLSLFSVLPPEEAADLMESMHFYQGASILDEMEPDTAAPILAHLDSDDRADLLNELDEEDSSAILEQLDVQVADQTRRLMAYEEGTAGSLMYSEFLSFAHDRTVREILEDLRQNREEYSEYGVQYAYVLNDSGQLMGVLPVRNLLFARPSQTASEIMIREPVTVHADAPLDELEGLFEEYGFLGLPVVDEQDHLLGIVDRSAPVEAMQEAMAEDLLKVQGLMGKEELRSMPLLSRSRRRLSWLSINIVLNLISASVIALFQDTLQAVIALAVFIPIISDMSGCSGNQAVAVSMRELTLGLISPKEFGRVFLKESTLGLINGTCLGLLIGAIAWIWKGNVYLGAVVGVALALNTTIAVCVGGLVPLILKSFRQDPALASGPILTTITDLCGFILILGLATLFLPHLS